VAGRRDSRAVGELLETCSSPASIAVPTGLGPMKESASDDRPNGIDEAMIMVRDSIDTGSSFFESVQSSRLGPVDKLGLSTRCQPPTMA